jgi:hypothetical protein
VCARAVCSRAVIVAMFVVLSMGLAVTTGARGRTASVLQGGSWAVVAISGR